MAIPLDAPGPVGFVFLKVAPATPRDDHSGSGDFRFLFTDYLLLYTPFYETVPFAKKYYSFMTPPRRERIAEQRK